MLWEKSNDGALTCHVFSLVDAVTHVTVSNPIGFLNIEKLFHGTQGAIKVFILFIHFL